MYACCHIFWRDSLQKTLSNVQRDRLLFFFLRDYNFVSMEFSKTTRTMGLCNFLNMLSYTAYQGTSKLVNFYVYLNFFVTFSMCNGVNVMLWMDKYLVCWFPQRQFHLLCFYYYYLLFYFLYFYLKTQFTLTSLQNEYSTGILVGLQMYIHGIIDDSTMEVIPISSL